MTYSNNINAGKKQVYFVLRCPISQCLVDSRSAIPRRVIFHPVLGVHDVDKIRRGKGFILWFRACENSRALE